MSDMYIDWHGPKGYELDDLRELSDEQLKVVKERICLVQEERWNARWRDE